MLKETHQASIVRKVVRNMILPAVLVSMRSGHILCANDEMIRRFGNAFAEDLKLDFQDLPRKTAEPGTTVDLVMSTPAEGGRPLFFREGTPSRAQFELMYVDGETALILAKSNQISFENKEPELVLTESFHFSYLESLSTAKRTCSTPELLEKLGISFKSNWRSLIAEEDLPLYDNAVAGAKKSGGDHELQYRLKTADGHLIQVTDYFSITQPEGKWPMLVGTIVSSSQTAEERQSMERMMLQSRLLGGMIHDFKNLVGGIQNIIEWVISISNDPKIVEALSGTLPYTEQATQLISATLNLSSGRRDHSRIEPLKFSEVIQEIEDILRRTMPATIRLNIDVENGENAFYGQKETIKDILLNLCVNARDAMKQKGSALDIRIFPTEQPASDGKTQAMAGIRLRDNGCGMSKTQLQSLFQAFYSTKPTGVGLGLWMVREAVKSFDGRIQVSSEEGKGTTFEILFPAMEQEKQVEFEHRKVEVPEEKKTRKTLSLAEEKTVLLVEDEELIRSSVASFLESMGLHLLIAGDGKQAMELFQDHCEEIDLVLQDYIVPGIRGNDLLKHFLAKRNDIPVIVGSANPDSTMADALKRAGAVDFLPKPFRMEELLDRIEKVFDSAHP